MNTSLTDLLRRRRVRQPLDETLPDGGSVQDLLERVNQPQVLTPQNQQAITRPRTSGAVPTYNVPESEQTRPRTVSFDPQTGRPNEDYYRESGDTAGLYNAYQNWNPHGGKRGFKNSLKAAVMMGAEGARNNPDDPVTGALAGLAIGAGAGTAVPNFTNRLRRQQKLNQFGGELQNQLALQKEQANIDATTMTPVQLDNGQVVMVPAKQAATLASKQQEIGLRGNTLEAHKKRWDQLGEHEGARDAQALYNSGAADDSAELRAEIAKRLRLPAGTVLPPRGLGNQVKLDETGNYVVISPRSGAATSVQTSSGKPAVSFQKTQEGNRDVRQRRALTAADKRAQYTQEQINRRAGMRSAGVKLDPTTKRDIAKGYGEYGEFQSGLSAIDEQIKQANALPDNWVNTDGKETKNQYLARLGRKRNDAVATIRKRMAELNQLDPENEWGSGEGGYPYRKPKVAASLSSEDPKVRAYADKFFHGDYAAAQAAIKKQRGQ